MAGVPDRGDVVRAMDAARADFALSGQMLELFAYGMTAAAVSRELGISHTRCLSFRRSWPQKIEARREQLEQELALSLPASVWITDKAARVQAYQDTVDRLDAELLREELRPIDIAALERARGEALHAVAEELGQLPPRVVVASQTVVNFKIDGVNMEAL